MPTVIRTMVGDEPRVMSTGEQQAAADGTARGTIEPDVFERVMGAAMELTRDVEALAAVVAHVRHVTTGSAHPAARTYLDDVASVAVPGIADVDPEQLRTVSGLLTSIFRQAADLIERPDRAPGWVYDDPVVLQATGRASMSVVGVLAQIAPGLDGLSDRLAAGGRFCDVGTGTGWLAIAAARAWPAASVVGLDVYAAALALAARNVADAGLGARVVLRHLDICDLAGDEFDLVWIPGPFLPEHIVDDALAASWRNLRPGGWVAFGIYGGPSDPLAQRLADLRTVRSGGHPWTAATVCERLVGVGFGEVREIERKWNAPVRLIVGRRD